MSYEATVHCTGLYIPIAPCFFFKARGQISVKVTGTQRNNGIGLEIPASYNFYHKKPSKIKKLIELLRDKEGTPNL